MYVVSMVDIWMGEWSKDYLAQAQLLHQKKSKRVIPIETCKVCSSLTQKTRSQA